MLRSLHLKDVGPAPSLDFEFAPRLNLLTGDNGLGKTLILDAAWWAMTWTWAGEAARPSDRAEPVSSKGRSVYLSSRIDYTFDDDHGHQREYTGRFATFNQSWIPETKYASHRAGEGLFPGDGVVLYARVDGGFAVWDAYRNLGRMPQSGTGPDERPPAFIFDRGTVWNGLEENGQTRCNGLIRDWVSWQQTNNGAWHQLAGVLKGLSGAGVEAMVPGKPARVKLNDARDVPTLDLAYGNVPVTHASAGMRRICALAYMVVWAWQEHRLAAKLQRLAPSHDLLVLIDEVESHLHPAWQRRVVPALLEVLHELDPEVRVQLLVATHAPLVLASLEPHFDSAKDALFMFDLTKRGVPRSSKVERAEWRRMGDASNWLTSEVFDLKSARSREAEEALESAYKALDNPDTTLDQARRIHRKLQGVLKETDPFWARWHLLAERLGIEA